MTDPKEDQMWALARSCGLTTATPGTQKQEEAIFKFGRAMLDAAPVLPAPQAAVAWVRRHPDGALTAEFLEDAVIEPVRRNSGAWVPLYAAAPALADLTDAQKAAPELLDALEKCEAVLRANKKLNGTHFPHAEDAARAAIARATGSAQ